MTAHLSRNKRFFRCKKGYSGILATIFMVLVLFYLFGILTIFQSQNSTLQDATAQAQQLDSDRSLEHLQANVTLSGSSIRFNVTNSGPLPVQIVRIWVISSSGQYYNAPVSLALSPGSIVVNQNPGITLSSGSITSCWLVTGRGNLVYSTIK